MTDPDALLEEARTFIDGLVERAGLDLGPAQGRLDGETIALTLDGGDNDLLLEDSARLLYALNHLVNQVFFRRSRPFNFVLDCEGYLRMRAYELTLMARKAAEHAQSMRQKVALQPMTSSERRIIHLTLADDETVRTESEGTGGHRHVLIVPA